jgi:hypothetical protein
MTRDNMKTPIEHTILAVLSHTEAATNDELALKVDEKLSGGYRLYSPLFFSEKWGTGQ